jgi:hypothetical protein
MTGDTTLLERAADVALAEAGGRLWDGHHQVAARW